MPLHHEDRKSNASAAQTDYNPPAPERARGPSMPIPLRRAVRIRQLAVVLILLISASAKPAVTALARDLRIFIE